MAASSRNTCPLALALDFSSSTDGLATKDLGNEDLVRELDLVRWSAEAYDHGVYCSATRSHSPDPFSVVLLPPPNESSVDREKRLRAEGQAEKISDDIDKKLEAERNESRRKKPVKILLLGQSESGKSTVVKRTSALVFLNTNFALAYSSPL